MTLQRREHFVGVPGGIAEFDDVASPARQRAKKDFESLAARRAQRPPRRQLIQGGTEGRGEPFRARKEELERRLRILEFLHVRQKTAGFYAVYKPTRCASFPRRESCGIGQPIKGVVDPMLVLPAGAADENGWGKFLIHLRLQPVPIRVNSLHVSAPPRKFLLQTKGKHDLRGSALREATVSLH